MEEISRENRRYDVGHWAAGIIIFSEEICNSRPWGSFRESICGAGGPLVALGGQLVMLGGICGTWGPSVALGDQPGVLRGIGGTSGPFVALGDQPVMLRGICGTWGPSVALGGQPVRQCAQSGHVCAGGQL